MIFSSGYTHVNPTLPRGQGETQREWTRAPDEHEQHEHHLAPGVEARGEPGAEPDGAECGHRLERQREGIAGLGGEEDHHASGDDREGDADQGQRLADLLVGNRAPEGLDARAPVERGPERGHHGGRRGGLDAARRGAGTAAHEHEQHQEPQRHRGQGRRRHRVEAGRPRRHREEAGGDQA